LKAAGEAVIVQQLRVHEFEDLVTEARRELAECTRQVEILNKHRERLASRFRREMEAKEAREQDEMGNIIFLRKRQAS
jgi:flagellar biosynthesis chaperone FliJ